MLSFTKIQHYLHVGHWDRTVAWTHAAGCTKILSKDAYTILAQKLSLPRSSHRHCRHYERIVRVSLFILLKIDRAHVNALLPSSLQTWRSFYHIENTSMAVGASRRRLLLRQYTNFHTPHTVSSKQIDMKSYTDIQTYAPPTPTHTHVHTCTHPDPPTHTHKCNHTHKYSHTQRLKHTRMHTTKRMHANLYAHTYANCMHTDTVRIQSGNLCS
jgi:hypothetical protein